MPRILVVDDNERIVEVLEAYLRSEGFEVITAADGESAIRAVAEDRPDLALVDIMLPGVNGLELTRRFQAEYGMPVILVTARSEESDALQGFNVGADDYVTKPFSPKEVVARVKAVLRRASGASEADETLSVGDLRVDRLRRAVSVGGRDVDLTRTEFDMLALMASRPGQVFARLQLLEAVTGEAYEGYERTVDAHIKNLRRKLGDDPKSPKVVHTVIGVGYKVESR